MILPRPTISLSTDASTQEGWVNSATRVLGQEATALNEVSKALHAELKTPFTTAVALIAKSTGRVIVSGIGKSGHIGNKIAATLASTGTPAFFVHASEASHGDLGMITQEDVVIALSWSGDTQELSSLIAFTRRFKIPLIAITRSSTSALGSAADVALALPHVEEACPHGLAPTTSTIMQMAMGDALAITLLEARGFSAQDFKIFHPGGRLGANLMYVKEIMHTGSAMPLALMGTSMREAIVLMTQKGFGVLGITNNQGNLVGIITDGDLRRHISMNFLDKPVEDIMTRSPVTIKAETHLGTAIELLNSKAITSLFIVENNRPAGIIRLHDLLKVGAA
ncbi:KpsF/GutQ family sugar-phosphate isomerase [Polycladidibacter hongkongensis]|uniref:KpsF/GutQ family sugar-phosphate isomerase n=1 Tax=Polycladidibacter hongkongensis TaxID=1647556 RepID=UPI0008337320|nr:KpsF/GutQ family sugar-phosphate isomerase [Pseudovibrio hongkongensis]